MGGNRKERKLNHQRAMARFVKQKHRNYLAKPGPHEFIVVLDNLKPSYNIGKIIRSADAFGAHALHLIGIDFFDPAPAKGSFKWVPSVFHQNFADCYKDLTEQGYTFFVLEPESGQFVGNSKLPAKSAFVMGHEEFGISFAKNDFPGIKTLTIPQYGKVQSLNVSIAASIMMYEYSRQHSGDTAQRMAEPNQPHSENHG